MGSECMLIQNKNECDVKIKRIRIKACKARKQGTRGLVTLGERWCHLSQKGTLF